MHRRILLRSVACSVAFLVSMPLQASSGGFTVEEGDDGSQIAYLTVSDKVSLALVSCIHTKRAYEFEIAASIDDPPPGSMLETLRNDTASTVEGRMCVGPFCRTMEFDRSDYFTGPSKHVEFDSNHVEVADSLSIEFPGHLVLRWEGRLKDVLLKICQNL